MDASNFVTDVTGRFYRLKVKALFAPQPQNRCANQAILCGTAARRFKFRVNINRRRHGPAGNNEDWADAA
jgi:hypothetical protein